MSFVVLQVNGPFAPLTDSMKGHNQQISTALKLSIKKNICEFHM